MDIEKLESVWTEGRTYYIPKSETFPVIDGLAIYKKGTKKSAIGFQMTVAKSYKVKDSQLRKIISGLQIAESNF
eukprot:m.72805 g.72805  ORF g.72805 m.72805 type:complete len:74 (+) comp35816_c0_seq1:1455-1676(+)